jgi:hypothetical protein
VARDYWLKPIYPEQIPYVAAELLASGYDSPSLREAAGVSAADSREARMLFIESQGLKPRATPERTGWTCRPAVVDLLLRAGDGYRSGATGRHSWAKRAWKNLRWRGS